LSVDFEDWHQLVRRRLGVSEWEQAGPALARQTAALLDLLDELGAKATFFILGVAARTYPRLVEEIAERGHEIGCHGDRHVPVFSQSPTEFAEDLRTARQTIAAIVTRPPAGYRAPAFSITEGCPWAYRVLVEEGFTYDASMRHPLRILGSDRPVSQPHALSVEGKALWEFPVATWQGRYAGVPVGGASIWAITPTATILRGLERAGAMAGLYLHPYELDPEPLRVALSPGASASQRLHGRLREVQRNMARRRATEVLRAVASRYPLIPYGDAYARLA
jgi:polysaccharide deacetylase family protein (PEP-CTERM system associated)